MEYIKYCPNDDNIAVFDENDYEIGTGYVYPQSRKDNLNLVIVKSFGKQYAFTHMCLNNNEKSNEWKTPLMTIENDFSMKKLRLILLNEQFIPIKYDKNNSLWIRSFIHFNKYWIEGIYYKLTNYLHCKVCCIRFAVTEGNIRVV